MGETPDQLKRQVEEARARLDQDLNQLEYRMRAATDWRRHFNLHPWRFVGAAFGGALLLGMMLSGSRRA